MLLLLKNRIFILYCYLNFDTALAKLITKSFKESLSEIDVI